MRIAFIGSAGIPNRYGGFEAFVEHCAPELALCVESVTVTCDAGLYPDRAAEHRGVRRTFIGVPANGAWSVLHDLLAFAAVFRRSTHVVVLGVSGGLWFPLFRLGCAIAGKRLLVNIDGVEWRRTKFSRSRRVFLRLLDALAQASAHGIVYDNAALRGYVLRAFRPKSVEIAYPGDHVERLGGVDKAPGTALTVCRVEPENNLELLVEGALRSGLRRYTIVGNWGASAYGRALRERWSGEGRLELLDAIYDPARLAQLREGCETYLHGHSVGGTNPSLVEMLFYDCRILCFDCAFNRETAGDAASYFTDATSLASLIDGAQRPLAPGLTALRERYTKARIARAYLSALG
jgi:glycosyltransferase involved in cell wall biosynthesis